ncbi:MAG: class III poly(R)-hydroxyalkanoic acid synthase subunit PhaC [Steroidobacteraceae bacterium]|jgi:polyhydroxyalkanoate synthase
MTGDGLHAALAAANRCAPGCSPKDAVWQSGKLTLYRYRAIAPPSSGAPLLIVYALVNRPTMMDLQEDRSLIRGLLSEGIDVYLIDWGYPDGADRFTTLADYIDDYLDGCVDQILKTHELEALNILGVCQGGVFSLCYAALNPRRVRNLITMVTPVDFHTPGNLLSKWVRKIDVASFVGEGNVSGDVLNQVFLSLMPFRLTQQKYVDLLTQNPNQERIENFMRVEQWIFDSPDQAGAAFREFLEWFYQDNRLALGELELGGRKVDLRALRAPVLNLIGKLDHLVPPDASTALQAVIGSRDYTALQFDLGHIGMYISARAQREVPSAIARWLATR